MKPLTLAIPVALLSLVAACGTSSTPVDRTTAAPQTTEPAAQPTSAEPTAGGSASAGAAGAALTGEVASDAFVITLKDDKGAPVTTLKAGTYQVKIKDASKIHNFHLTGAGVDEKTTIPELKDVTWSVTFKAGTYTYLCDPHPSNMKKTITVS